MSEISSTHAVVIPVYNAGPNALQVVRDVMERWQPVWVVIDGSSDTTSEEIETLGESLENLHVLRHPVNRGKGSAVLTGAAAAHAAGFTHILAFDADGQHPADMVQLYMQVSRENPHALLCGTPVFPANAPPERIAGRKLANFWTNFVTGWWGIRDVLFGMRVFPLADLLEVMARTRFGRRYDFECESGIRLCWRQLPVINLPTPVRYLSAGEGGVSHYHYLWDNLRLAGLFLRLMPQGILRWPLQSRRVRGGTDAG